MNTTTNKEEKQSGLAKAEHAAPCLAIHTSPQSSFLLPYYHFLGGEFERPADRKEHEVLILEFALHTVQIKGFGLEAVFKAVQFHKAKTLAPSPVGLEAATVIVEISAFYRSPNLDTQAAEDTGDRN